ncbi:hypothetical protein TNCV_4288001 [Trichonephila clavipes]|uniref:Uncharacterized protein n=1 Tax=Trichonephila clavipes TaxID=2585209 RepID=A0A8X6VCT2_TRICX|nr:hypothetical protein TNCV_4288001 [Trichonephila clavipes]
MVRKKSKVIPERRRSKNASTTSRDGSESATSEEPPGVAGMELTLPASPQASRPGTPEKAGPTQLHCKKLPGLAYLIEVLSMESAALELNNTRLQSAVSEYTSLPPCGIPNCSRHNIKDTPLKLNVPDPSPPPTPIPTKRKENEGFTSPPSRKLTKSTPSNSNTGLNFKINLTNAFSALDNTATKEPIETPVTTNKSPETTPRKTNQSIQSPKLPPPSCY